MKKKTQKYTIICKKCKTKLKGETTKDVLEMNIRICEKCGHNGLTIRWEK